MIWFNFNTFKIGDEKTFIHLDDDDDDDVGRRRSENFFFFCFYFKHHQHSKKPAQAWLSKVRLLKFWWQLDLFFFFISSFSFHLTDTETLAFMASFSYVDSMNVWIQISYEWRDIFFFYINHIHYKLNFNTFELAINFN